MSWTYALVAVALVVMALVLTMGCWRSSSSRGATEGFNVFTKVKPPPRPMVRNALMDLQINNQPKLDSNYERCVVSHKQLFSSIPNINNAKREQMAMDLCKQKARLGLK
jgi:hypothetical protein